MLQAPTLLGTLFVMFLAPVFLLVVASLATAQTKGPNACDLLSTADVVRVTGRGAGDAMPTPNGCMWETAQVYVFTANVDQRIETMTKSFGQRGANAVPLAGLGEKAMSFAPEPRDKYDDRVVYVVARQGRYLVQTSVLVPKGKTASTVQPQAVELAKIILPKLK